jgi:nucleotide-binding universal stress UspA family protein
MTLVRDRARVHLHSGAEAEPVYRRILVPLSADPESLHALPSACSLAAPDRGSLVGVFVIELPTELPLEAHMFDAERRAREALEHARAEVEAWGLRFSGRLVRAHGAAEAIIAEAERLTVDLIVLAARRRPSHRLHAPLFDEVVRDVLADAPCRVMVITPPPSGADDGH